MAGLLEHALVRDSPSELHAAAREAVLEVAAADPPAFAGHYRQRVTWLQGFLGHVDAAGAIPQSWSMNPVLLTVLVPYIEHCSLRLSKIVQFLCL